MFKKIITISLILGLSNIAAYAKVKQEIGNQINEKEFPSSAKVLPVQPKKENPVVIEGSVQKNVDMTLDKCLEIALGNNPQINAAFQDILASDARIKQVWAN